LEITREVVGALTRIASGTQVQAAETLKRAEPIFRHLDNSEPHMPPGIASTRPTRGSLAFRNDGGTVNLLSLESRNPRISVELESPGWCHPNEVFHLIVQADGPLKSTGAIDVTVTLEDKFRRVGKAEITAAAFGERAVAKIQMGDAAAGA
jgi:hypothetical protein